MSGGHAFAHAPLQALWVPLSFSNRYIVRPEPSTMMRPSLVLRTVTVAAPLDFAAGTGRELAPATATVPNASAPSVARRARVRSRPLMGRPPEVVDGRSP